MDEELKVLAHKIVNSVARKIRKDAKTNYLKFGNSMGLGADGTITKYVDKIAEDAALNVFNKSKLKINLLSEEVGYLDNKGKYTFVLDPIDGTRNAYRGIPFYSISLGVGKQNLSGVEYAIVKNIPTGDEFVAEKGHGAFFNKQQICVPEIPDKELLCSLSLGKHSDKLSKKLASKDYVRSLGSASLEMCMVAFGSLDYYLVSREYIRIVDIAASTLILREAGGVVTNILGQNLEMGYNLADRSSVVAACNLDLIEKIIS